jgi:hypothetical protein
MVPANEIAAISFASLGSGAGSGSRRRTIVVVDDGYRYTRNLDDARYWAEARTLSDLGELTARWLEGAIDYQPAWESARPDAETEPLVAVLALANRRGFVTHFSQPGANPDPARNQQRAAVSGFSTEEGIDRLENTALGTDLVVLAYPPGRRLDGHQLPIAMLDGVACRWAGAEMSFDAIQEYYRGDCHPDAVTALHQAWQATLIDPHWGRNDLLWDRLQAALSAKDEAAR